MVACVDPARATNVREAGADLSLREGVDQFGVEGWNVIGLAARDRGVRAGAAHKDLLVVAFVRADAKYFNWESDVPVAAARVGKLKVTPRIYGISAGLRFRGLGRVRREIASGRIVMR